MITPNEIRYGNWVQNQNGYPIRVNFHFFEMIELLGKAKTDACSGISLTPEILEKCGFKITTTDHTYGNGVIGLFFLEGEYSYGIAKGKYLHQLQNLFYCLTGQELEVKL